MKRAKPSWDVLTLGRRIKAARVRRGFSPTILAAFCGVTEQMVGRWEADDALPSPARLVRISTALGVSETMLIKGGDTWDSLLLGLQRVSTPDVFLPPTQWPTELGIPDDAQPYRAKPEVGPPEPAALPPVAPPPVDLQAEYEAEQQRRLMEQYKRAGALLRRIFAQHDD